MRAGSIDPNCDFHIVSSTFGCTGKVTPKRSWGLVNSTYSWANTAPATLRIRAADTALTRMLSSAKFPGCGQPTLDRNVRVVNQMGSDPGDRATQHLESLHRRGLTLLELEIDDHTHGAERQRARSKIPVESGPTIGVRLHEGRRRRDIGPAAGEDPCAHR